MQQNKDAVIYSRTASAIGFAKSEAIVSQEERCREYARRKGYNVVDAFWDVAVAATIRERPQLEEMLDFLAFHRAASPVVIVDSPERLARDAGTYTMLRDAIHDRGATLESPAFDLEGTPDKGLPFERPYAEQARVEARLNDEAAEGEPGKSMFRQLLGALIPRSSR